MSYVGRIQEGLLLITGQMSGWSCPVIYSRGYKGMNEWEENIALPSTKNSHHVTKRIHTLLEY